MNQIVINIDEFQSRAAIIEDGKVVEILVEREEEGRINGSDIRFFSASSTVRSLRSVTCLRRADGSF